LEETNLHAAAEIMRFNLERFIDSSVKGWMEISCKGFFLPAAIEKLAEKVISQFLVADRNRKHELI